MTIRRTGLCHGLATGTLLILSFAAPAADAQTSTAPIPGAASRSNARTQAKKPVAAKGKIEYVPAEAATPEQVDAADRVYYGVYDCEFKQTVAISKSQKFPAYVDLRHGKAAYIMKPVLSSTGAIRLEDIRGETLMVQISSKSMLLNVKTAQRIVDDCISPSQRELIDSARAAKAAAVASASASAAEQTGADVMPVESGLLRSAPTPASAPR